MAQFFLDIASLAVDQAPDGFTPRFNTEHNWVVRSKAWALYGKSIEFAPVGSTHSHGLSWDAASGTDTGNVEIVGRMRSSSIAVGRQVGLMVRGGGHASAIQGYMAQLLGEGYLYLFQGSSSTISALAGIALSWSKDTPYWMRLRAEGSTLRAKAWAHGTQEPDWQLTTTNSMFSVGGWNGLFQQVASGLRDWDALGIGTDGDPAPTEPVTASARRPWKHYAFGLL